jgi:hypothetical protein
MSVPEPTGIAMLPPEPDADEPLPISKALLSPTVALPVLNDRSPDTPDVPALLVNTATLPELVAVYTPDEMVMEKVSTNKSFLNVMSLEKSIDRRGGIWTFFFFNVQGKRLSIIFICRGLHSNNDVC